MILVREVVVGSLLEERERLCKLPCTEAGLVEELLCRLRSRANHVHADRCLGLRISDLSNLRFGAENLRFIESEIFLAEN